ncbi:dTDP-4-dehydrorhamnose 3,5-epimerase [Paenibacillus turicensis]|uniref:dTDP-4-dehydrorhamnose 3,5-epimerase n=1 Tax=Paenibacillus turicensis TaxID=160487 RepID=A0ABS4FXB7_9BACL|nr:dTDP-4-dehydrorhamnose 3,5-epimerase [Paenibacillus turicensis]MBP1907222.1 dTDP-4-dehydrorhamnose 3,5-epimerase [Paenibacillus turicensis]
MEKVNTDHPELFILEPEVFSDNRGWFMENWSEEKLSILGIGYKFIQENHSFTKKSGTIRGLHFQINPWSQTKLIRCTSGSILDVAVDLRVGSPYYLKWIGVELSSLNKRQLIIPRGFAHGFLTLTDNVEVIYKVDNYYCKESDRSIRYSDPNINVSWGIDKPILSLKDSSAPFLSKSDCNFFYEEI